MNFFSSKISGAKSFYLGYQNEKLRLFQKLSERPKKKSTMFINFSLTEKTSDTVRNIFLVGHFFYNIAFFCVIINLQRCVYN